MLSAVAKSDKHQQDTSLKLQLSMHDTHAHKIDTLNWFCSVACIWAHCDIHKNDTYIIYLHVVVKNVVGITENYTYSSVL